ncbi:MAG TPA: hypothetical protein VHZ96_08755, partial [Frankiaceae bacterium]|nr:hypothetical protein [Frankiaceae bacterium]
TLTITATNAGGTGTASYSWLIIPIPVPLPSVVITSAPLAETTATDATISFTVSDPIGTVTCTLDGAASSSCSSPWKALSLAPGTHTLTITATNAGGTATASYTWTIVPAPATAIALTFTPPGPGPKKTFSWTQTAGLSYQCSLDGAAFTSCANTITYNKLKAGNHAFSIHSTNAIGNIGTDTTYTWKA